MRSTDVEAQLSELRELESAVRVAIAGETRASQIARFQDLLAHIRQRIATLTNLLSA